MRAAYNWLFFLFVPKRLQFTTCRILFNPIPPGGNGGGGGGAESARADFYFRELS